MRLIGVLMGHAESDPAAQSMLAALRVELVKLGWREGSNIRIELRWGAGDADKIRSLAKELVDLRPDAILGHPVTAALTRPIVVAVSDPISSGFAANLTHPGSNITGFTADDPSLSGKWVQLLKEIAPRTAQAALLFNSATVPSRPKRRTRQL
jgi:putative ABC transport system substrate-binding protein